MNTKLARRSFLQHAAGAAALAAVGRSLPATAAENENTSSPSGTPAGPPRLIVNHVGFLPNGAKYFVVENPPTEEFSVVRFVNEKGRMDFPTVHQGRLRRVDADLGPAWVGEFNCLREEGLYLIRCGSLQSRMVQVYRRLYDYPLRVLFNYFPSQRCGDSATGYNAPCHVDDARRVDTGEHLDVTGGWHQSCDCRKWMLGTPYGLLGLTQLARTNRPRWDRGQIDEELRWGNRYFLKMIRPDGALMDHVVMPLGWDGVRDLYANDAPLPAVHLTITGLALTADHFGKRDPKYRRACLAAARKLWTHLNRPEAPRTSYSPPVVPPYHDFLRDWFRQQYPGSALAVGDSLYTALRLHVATGERPFLDRAIKDARCLLDLQIGGPADQNPLAACFRESPGKTELASCTYYGILGPLGVCELLEREPRHADAGRWLDAIHRLAEQYCTMSQRNPWGLIPSYWYAQDPGHGRKAGSGFYKYFHNQSGLKIGVNLDILGKSLFLLRAHRLLNQRRCLDTACRQIDWILGCNPYDMSTVEAVGYNQPVRMISGEFFPPTPQIPGGVMTGILGDDNDEPRPDGGVSHEYDLPPTSMLMWMLAEIQASV